MSLASKDKRRELRRGFGPRQTCAEWKPNYDYRWEPQDLVAIPDPSPTVYLPPDRANP
jgi:hypothetical protein